MAGGGHDRCLSVRCSEAARAAINKLRCNLYLASRTHQCRGPSDSANGMTQSPANEISSLTCARRLGSWIGRAG
eukprot:6175398-Pleurochrysis_carterae.AAC.1